MINRYEGLRNNLKRLLNRFGLELLGFNLLKGVVIFLVYILVYLLLYWVLFRCSFLTVGFKSFLYYLFWTGVFTGIFYCFIYPVVLFFISRNFKRSFLLKKFLREVKVPRDIFITLFHLAFRFDAVPGDPDLKKAAFVQKYESLIAERSVVFVPFRKKCFRFIVSTLFLIFVLFGSHKFFLRIYADFSNYQEVSVPGMNIDFHLLNESLNVEYGKPFQLQLLVKNEYLPDDNVFVCFGGGEFYMNRKDSVFVYDFDVVNNDIRFSFKTSGVESRSFQINVLPSPEITDYQVNLISPAYTGLKPELLKNIADFRVLFGSVLKFDVHLSSVDSLFIGQTGGQLMPLKLKNNSNVVFSKDIRSSAEYVLYGSNRYFSRKKLITFNVTCIPDLYPGIQLSVVQDSLKNSVFYYYGIITDDYGFSALRFNYSMNGKTNTVVPVNILKNTNTQEFYFEFDFAEFAGMDKTKIDYFFEVFDNDCISGPKSTRSDSKEYLIPDLNAIFDYNAEVNAQVNNSLNEAEKLAKDIVSGVKDLQKKMLDNSVDNWEKQQLAKDIVEKKEKLDKLLHKVQEDHLKKSALNNSFTSQDSILISKQEKIQELLDKIMDDEMKKLMDEFSRLSDEFSKDKFQDLDEKMKLSFDQMSEELDRNIELLKRYQVEEQHHMLSQQFDGFKQSQKNLEEALKSNDLGRDSLNKINNELKNKLENIRNNYDRMLNDNQQLSKPFDLKKMSDDFSELSQMIDKQKDNISNKKDNSKTSEDIKEKSGEISKELEEQRQQNFTKMSIPENDIELIIQNILVISLSQEELLKQFSETPAQSARYNELGRLQDLKKMEYKIVKDSLSLLAKSNLMLASVLSDKFYDIEIKFGLLLGYIQNNKRSELSREQQYIISYLNDMALALSDALQKSQSEGKGSGKGSDQKGKKGNGEGQGSGKEGYEGMKKIQSGLKKQLENLISQMKNGEKGKPLQQGVSNMIRENELFRKSLNDFMSQAATLSPAERQLLNEINQLLDDNIRDLSNYSISDNLMYRNNQVYNKLLLSEKASKEREEYEEKRKSVTATEMKYKRPEAYFKSAERRIRMVKTDLNKSDMKLNPYFKSLYNNYYIKLGDE